MSDCQFVHQKSHVGLRIDRPATVRHYREVFNLFVCLFVCIHLHLLWIEMLQFARCTVPRLISVTCIEFRLIGELPLSSRI